jgi:hypothetical protein
MAEYKIDWKFIETVEGQKTEAYVPVCTVKSSKNPQSWCYEKAAGTVIGKSGITIGPGFDLGQQNEWDLKRIGLNQTLKEKLKPYLGLKKKDALDTLNKDVKEGKLLTLTPQESNELNLKLKNDELNSLAAKYEKDSKGKKLTDLPEEAQTIILSFFHQYGVHAMEEEQKNLTAQKFWGNCIDQDWKAATSTLNGSTAYTGRRKMEAGKIEALVKK